MWVPSTAPWINGFVGMQGNLEKIHVAGAGIQDCIRKYQMAGRFQGQLKWRASSQGARTSMHLSCDWSRMSSLPSDMARVPQIFSPPRSLARETSW